MPNVIYSWLEDYKEELLAYCRNDAVTGWLIVAMYSMRLVTRSQHFQVEWFDTDYDLMGEALRVALAETYLGNVSRTSIRLEAILFGKYCDQFGEQLGEFFGELQTVIQQALLSLKSPPAPGMDTWDHARRRRRFQGEECL